MSDAFGHHDRSPTDSTEADPPDEKIGPFLARRLGFLVAVTAVALVPMSLRGWLQRPAGPAVMPIGDAQLGRAAIITHGCGACHVIPGLASASGRVGPKLEDLHEQMFIGGHLANTPRNLAAWIRNPQHFAPGTAMPNLNISEQEADAIAAYLLQQQ